MDIKEKIEEIVAKVKSSKDLTEKFKSDPVKTVEGLLGVDIPDEIVEKIVAGVKAKIGVDAVSGIASKLGGLFGKKK